MNIYLTQLIYNNCYQKQMSLTYTLLLKKEIFFILYFLYF